VKLSLNLPTDRVELPEEFVTGKAIAEMAVMAEAAGFDSVAVTDHPFPDDQWMRAGGHHALDPMVALAFAAAATTTLRVRTNLYIAAYRNPFLSAKAIASLDILSGGRVILGIGTGYLEPEFRALGVPFEDRNELTDEAIVAMKRAWAEEGVTFKGRAFEATGNSMLPHPVQRPHPPIWIGGNSKRAVRRAVELGDGWLPFPNPAQAVTRRRTPAMETLDDLRAGIAYARDYERKVGRMAPIGVSFSLGGIAVPHTSTDPTGASVEIATQLAAAGVTDLSGGVARVDSRAAFLAEVERMGSELVPRIAEIELSTGGTK
jgi:probable F420-dependent oxidoreductase